ncbi:MAG: chemotaxis-specific protein-glutamate methyltransferase CheB [Myxococcaceae bacterium]
MNRSRVLIVDDSTLSREVLRRALELDPHMQVVGEATSGEEALRLVRALSPDLITMDLNMPGMGGLKAIEALMKDRPTPIVVISERSSTSGVDLNYEALSRGALELVPKSTVFGAGDEDLRRFVDRLRLLAEAGIDESDKPAPPTAPAPTIPVSTDRPLMLGIGASTGGPRALAKLLSSIPRDFPLPIVVVQHMAEDFFDSFVRFLRDVSGHPVEQATALTHFDSGRVYVAPPRQELFVRENLTAKLLPPPPNALISPSVDSLFFSMATALKGRGLGVLLTGMGDDGAQGLLRMRRMGSRTVVQDKASCAVFGMPRAAIELGAAEHVIDLGAMGPFLVQAARGGPVTAPPPPVEPSAPPSATGLTPAMGNVLPPQTRTDPSAKKRVLVLDDQGHLDSAKAALERAGYDVVTLDNPLIIARTLRRNVIDLVLLEPDLKTMKGNVVIQTLRNQGVLAPVYLWSSLDESTILTRVREWQAAGSVKKGDPAALLRTVNRAFKQ